MDAPNKEFTLAGSLEELKAKGRLVVHGSHRPILVIYDRGRVLALDNRCPHMGFPLERGTVEDGILTCHWHHARFDLESGCTFDLWADDVPICPVEVRNGDVWVKTTFGHADAGISGAKGRNGRPGLDSMLKDASRRRFDVASSASGKAKGDSERSSGRGIDFGLGLRYQAIDGCESKQCSFMESVV
jgi:nitrite reductase/ring-hydroxylating ferredoxin subunit